MREYGLKPTEIDGRRYDLVVAAVAHKTYRDLADERVQDLLNPGGTLADIKGISIRRSTAGRCNETKRPNLLARPLRHGARSCLGRPPRAQATSAGSRFLPSVPSGDERPVSVQRDLCQNRVRLMA